MGASANFGPPGSRALGAAGDLGAPGNMGPPGGALGAAGDVFAPARTGEIVQMATLNPDGTSGGIIEEPASGTEKGKKKKKVVRRRKVVQTAEGEDDDNRATIDMGLNKAKRSAAKRAQKKKDAEKKRKARDETPSDGEDAEIDPTTMTLTELCKDLKIGKKFYMHDDIKLREMKKKQESQRNRMRENHPELVEILDAEDNADEARLAEAARRLTANATAADGDPGPSGTNAGTVPIETPHPPAQKEASAVPSASKRPQGPQMKVVDGVIVVDEQSLQMDRQAEGEAERADFEEIEENEFTRVVTSSSFMKKEKSNRWDAAATDMFYKLVGQYGTDFNTISKMFPHRSRRQIKLKFNTEERNNPDRITRYMTNPKKAIEMEQFEKLSGLKLQSKEDIEAEMAAFDREQQEAFDKVAEEKVAADRARKDEIKNTSEKRMAAKRILEGVGAESDDEAEAEAPSRGRGGSTEHSAAAATAKKGKGKAKAKKQRKNKHSMYAGGEDVVVVASIEVD